MGNGKFCIYCMNKMHNNERVCPYCGKINEEYQALNHHLIPYTILNGKYLIGRVLGEGGFGITYIARDLNLDVPVAVKEYFPYGCVNRNHSYSENITVSGTISKEEFEAGKNKLMNEARILARFSGLKGIVGVRDFFLFNNTAYIVMDYLEGVTLKEYFKSHGLQSFEWITELLLPIMKDLIQIHAAGLIHRDISPDNIMLLKDGTARLLDFGAARQTGASDVRSRSIVLKPGYTPEEQYRTKGELGPWTDVYALSATIYRAITGKSPDEALQRLVDDSMKRPSELGCQITPEQEQTLMKGLAISPRDRYQNFQEFIAALQNGEAATKQNRTESTTQKRSHKKTLFIAAVLLTVAVGIAAVIKFGNYDVLHGTNAHEEEITKNDVSEETVNGAIETEYTEIEKKETINGVLEAEDSATFTMDADPQGFQALAIPIDTCPILWYDYEGYMDEILDSFDNCDYDGDGLPDYVYRYCDVDKLRYSYEIRFGNGSTLMLDDDFDLYTNCSVMAVDLDDDEQNEILYVGRHTNSTQITNSSNIRIFHKVGGQWNALKLPTPDYTDWDSKHHSEWVGFDINFEYREKGMLTVSNKENEYQEIVKRYSEVSPEEFFPDGMAMEAQPAWDAKIIESNGKHYLALIQNISPPVTPYWYYQPIGSVLELRDNEFRLVRIGEDVAKRYWRNEWNYYIGTNDGPVLSGEETKSEMLIPKTNIPFRLSQMTENENGDAKNAFFSGDLHNNFINCFWVEQSGSAELCLTEDGASYLRNISLSFSEKDELTATFSVNQNGIVYSIGTGSWIPESYSFNGDTYVVFSAKADGKPCLCLFRQSDTSIWIINGGLYGRKELGENISIFSEDGSLIYTCNYSYTNNDIDHGIDEYLYVSCSDETGIERSYMNFNGMIEDNGFSSKDQALQYIWTKFEDLKITDRHFLGMIQLYGNYDSCYKEENGAYVIPVTIYMASKHKS